MDRRRIVRQFTGTGISSTAPFRFPARLRLSECSVNSLFQPDLGILVGQKDSHSGRKGGGYRPKQGKASLGIINQLIDDREVLCDCLPRELVIHNFTKGTKSMGSDHPNKTRLINPDLANLSKQL